MNDFLFYISQESVIKDIIIWGFFALVIIGMVLMLFIQQRHYKELKGELAELDKMHEHNVEFEFVLKAMDLAVWHLDVKSNKLTYDQDFREKSSHLILPNNATVDENTNMLDERDAERIAKTVKDICEGKIDDYHEVYRVKSPYSSKSFYWEESYATVAERDVEGMPTKIVGTTMRIDERKDLEEALVQARIRAEESDRLKSAFIANMSHEIRTPLNAIIGFTSVLPDVTTDEERHGLLDLIQENTQKLLRIIDDVVNISKVESGRTEINKTAFNLNEALRESMNQWAERLNPGVKLDSTFAYDSFTLTSDREKLEEIMGHLLSNAIKFTTQGSINVGYNHPEEGRVSIWVSDTGKGISEENLKHIFERFYKVDEFIPGAGLGLNVCTTMANSLGGSIGVESKLGEGSKFSLDIPVNL
ncbi:MAG: hypothetical protein J6Z14_15640 [Prevotella sp.]|nr:hypothetical protein [Prevotella sp.]